MPEQFYRIEIDSGNGKWVDASGMTFELPAKEVCFGSAAEAQGQKIIRIEQAEFLRMAV